MKDILAFPVSHVDQPEDSGRIPVRTELTVLSADNPKERKIGWTVKEKIGVGIYNHRGIMPVFCPVCGKKVHDIVSHADKVKDRNHEVLSVMAS